MVIRKTSFGMVRVRHRLYQNFAYKKALPVAPIAQQSYPRLQSLRCFILDYRACSYRSHVVTLDARRQVLSCEQGR
jgi:hypothetical protein